MRARSGALLMAALGMGLVGCGKEEVVELPPALQPVKTMVVEERGRELRSFPGRVEANRRAELSFRVPGKLAEILVPEGDIVSKGDVIARLDPTDYRLALENAQAEFERARSNFERAKSLVEEGHISRRQYDRDESSFKQTAASLRQAELNLSYCVMRAPFDGVMARRRVENFQEVRAKQELFSLRDLRELEIRIDVPESLVRLAERSGDEGLDLKASFPLAGNEQYPLEVKEVATRADPKTQTFEIKFKMPNPEGLNITSGMTALVTIDIRQVDTVDTVMVLPSSALDSREESPRVWVFEPELETVVPRPVTLAESASGKLRVRAGLTAGDRVVVAGVSSLSEGMDVYELPHIEQAEY